MTRFERLGRWIPAACALALTSLVSNAQDAHKPSMGVWFDNEPNFIPWIDGVPHSNVGHGEFGRAVGAADGDHLRLTDRNLVIASDVGTWTLMNLLEHPATGMPMDVGGFELLPMGPAAEVPASGIVTVGAQGLWIHEWSASTGTLVSTVIEQGEWLYAREVHYGDFDGDGVGDLVALAADGLGLLRRKGVAGSGFATPVPTLSLPEPAKGVCLLHWDDPMLFPGLEVALSLEAGGYRVMESDGDPITARGYPDPADSIARVRGNPTLGGRDMLLWAASFPSQTGSFIATVGEGVVDATLVLPGRKVAAITTGRIDGQDGIDDLAVSFSGDPDVLALRNQSGTLEYGTHHRSFVEGEGMSLLLQSSYSDGGEEPHSDANPVIGDVDADGEPDILMPVHLSNSIHEYRGPLFPAEVSALNPDMSDRRFKEFSACHLWDNTASPPPDTSFVDVEFVFPGIPVDPANLEFQIAVFYQSTVTGFVDESPQFNCIQAAQPLAGSEDEFTTGAIPLAWPGPTGTADWAEIAGVYWVLIRPVERNAQLELGFTGPWIRAAFWRERDPIMTYEVLFPLEGEGPESYQALYLPEPSCSDVLLGIGTTPVGGLIRTRRRPKFPLGTGPERLSVLNCQIP